MTDTKHHIDRARLGTACIAVASLVLAGPACSTKEDRESKSSRASTRGHRQGKSRQASTKRYWEGKSQLSKLVFPSSALPENVRLAPWYGSCKMPQVTSNPFLSSDSNVISLFEDREPILKGTVSEILVSAYWVGKVGESPVEIGLITLRFKDADAAASAAKAMQPQMEEHARAEPHTAPTLVHRGSIVCILGHTSAVDKDVWSAMVRLVEDALAEIP